MTAGRHALPVDPADLLDHLLVVDHNVRELRFAVADQSRSIAALEAIVASIPDLITRFTAATDRLAARLGTVDDAHAEAEQLRGQLVEAQAGIDAALQERDTQAVTWAAGQIEPLVARLEALVPVEEQPPA